MAEPDPPSYDDLARRYLDLWQDQWGAMLADPHTIEALTRLHGLFSQQMAVFAAFLGAAAPFTTPPGSPGTQETDDRAAPPPTAPSGTAAVGAAPVGGADGMAELARRLADVEERLAELEAQRTAARARRDDEQRADGGDAAGGGP